MNSLFDPLYRSEDFVPVIHAYYDRANMMETTPEMVNHTHSLCEIMYVSEGMMSIETEDGTARVGRKQFIWLDANVRHWNMRFSDGLCGMMNIEFQYERLNGRAPSLAAIAREDEATARLLSNPHRCLTLTDRSDTIFRLMKQIIQMADSTHEDGEKLCSLLCTQVMLEVARLSGQAEANNEPIRNRYISEALAIMNSDYAEPLTAAIVAERLHIKPTYLHRLFREHTARTMNEHLQQIRIFQAKKLLLETDKNLLEIAGEVGIGSQQHFTQLFKHIVGASPLEYRRQGRQTDSAQP